MKKIIRSTPNLIMALSLMAPGFVLATEESPAVESIFEDNSNLDKPIDEMNSSLAKVQLQTLIEQMSESADANTRKLLEEAARELNEVFDESRAPVLAIGGMVGLDGAANYSIKGSSFYAGFGGQFGVGPMITRHKREGSNISEQFGLSLFGLGGAEVHVKKSTAPLNTVTKQPFFGLMVIFPHKDENGQPKVKRLRDLRKVFVGAAIEGAIPVKFLNRVRGSIGVYSLLSDGSRKNTSALDAAKIELKTRMDQNKKSTDNKLALALKNTQSAYKSISDATMIVFTPQFGKDSPLELQAEALWLGIGDTISTEDVLDVLPFYEKQY